MQYLSWVFAEDKTQAAAALPSVSGTGSGSGSSSGVLDVYIVPKSDFIPRSGVGAVANAPAAATPKNKTSSYGAILREGVVQQSMSTMGMSSWKDRYAVLQDEVLFIFESKAAFVNKTGTASVCVPMGAVRARNAAEPDVTGSGVASVASPTNKGTSPATSAQQKEKDAKPNTIELSGGPLKMDVIRFAVDSKDSLDKWLDVFNNANLRLVKVC